MNFNYCIWGQVTVVLLQHCDFLIIIAYFDDYFGYWNYVFRLKEFKNYGS